MTLILPEKKKNVFFFYLIQFSWVLHDIVSLIYWTKFFAVLKSIYFKKTVVQSSFLSKEMRIAQLSSKNEWTLARVLSK